MLQVTLLGVWLVPAVVSIKMYFWRFCLVTPHLSLLLCRGGSQM